jgi:hypothetical protein
MVPGSNWTHVSGINNSGLMVGTFQDVSGNYHGFSYDGATYTTIDYPGAAGTYAIGVGPLGQIVGTHAPTPDGPWHAFIKEGDTFTSFDYPDMESDARAVNSTGQIAGVFNAGGVTPIHGFLKTGDAYTAIDYPGAIHTAVEGVNDGGVVTGAYSDPFGTHGFVYLGGTYVPVRYPTAMWTRLTRANNLNEFVGYANQSAGLHAFWLKGSSFRAFTTSFQGTTSAAAMAHNDNGHVVGSYYAPDCALGCGFLGVPNAEPPTCDQSVALSYNNGTLNVAYTIKSSVATTWTMIFRVLNIDFTMWTISVPPVPFTTTINLPIQGVPRIGMLTASSMLSTPSAGVVCGDYATVNTGTP